MSTIDGISAMFTARIELQSGQPVIELPERELSLGELEVGDAYKIAVLPPVRSAVDTESTDPRSERSTEQRSDAPPVEEGELIEVEVEGLGEKGDGIARVGPGYVVFIPDTQVGDRVTARIDQVRDNFAFAEVVDEEPINTS